jgi:methionine-S-sulfoxide reductase
MHDPTQLNRQGPDVGDSYRSAIFYLTDEQQKIASQEKDKAQANFKDKIVTEITQASDFYPAEDYHQKFAQRTGRGMCHIPYEPIPA